MRCRSSDCPRQRNDQKLPLARLAADAIVPRELTTSEGTIRTDVVEREIPRPLLDTKQYDVRRVGNAAGGRDGDLPLPRDGKFADSPLERVGFEAVVPPLFFYGGSG